VPPFRRTCALPALPAAPHCAGGHRQRGPARCAEVRGARRTAHCPGAPVRGPRRPGT
jgi:hypothetical protein